MTDIKRCPHCGGIAYINSRYSRKNDFYFVFVKCEVCGAQGKTCTSEEDPVSEEWDNDACRQAVTAWNLRIWELQQKAQ